MVATFFHAIGPPNGRTPAWLAGPNTWFSLPAPRWSRRILSLPNGQQLPGEGSLGLGEFCGPFSICNGNSSSTRKSSVLAPIPPLQAALGLASPPATGIGEARPLCNVQLLTPLRARAHTCAGTRSSEHDSNALHSSWPSVPLLPSHLAVGFPAEPLNPRLLHQLRC